MGAAPWGSTFRPAQRGTPRTAAGAPAAPTAVGRPRAHPWGPRGVGGITEEGPGWHTWTRHLQGFPAQAGAPPPPTRSHAGIAAPPRSGRRHSRAREGHWAPGPHKSPWPPPTADGRGPGRPLGPRHLERASAHFMAPAPKAPTKSAASTLCSSLPSALGDQKHYKLNYEKSEEIRTQPANNLSSREWEG